MKKNKDCFLGNTQKKITLATSHSRVMVKKTFCVGFKRTKKMGYDIGIIAVDPIEKKVIDRHEDYLTYNFSACKEFEVHDIDCKSGYYACKYINEVIEKMEQAGFKTSDPDMTQDSWGWGIKDKKIMELPQLAGVLMYHLQRFLVHICTMMKKHDHVYFVMNYSRYKSTIIDGVEYEEVNHNTSIVTYFRHPIKGQMTVNTFHLAMEVYGITCALNPAKAEAWLNLAYQMPDAPLRSI